VTTAAAEERSPIHREFVALQLVAKLVFGDTIRFLFGGQDLGGDKNTRCVASKLSCEAAENAETAMWKTLAVSGGRIAMGA
jgi:hypothetical protein